MTEPKEIRALACPSCIVCGSGGTCIYTGQKDRLFGAHGLWNFKKCIDPTCGLIWLDPMPIAEDIGNAYASYYTHQVRANPSRPKGLRTLVELMERGYWGGKYKYPVAQSIIVEALGKLLYLFPLRRNGADGYVGFLPAVPNGRLLDVGCGSGEWLLFMRRLGWDVEGIDFDERAVNAAAQNGLKVRCGALEKGGFPAESFDAVVLNHVIEHVPDPLATLKECSRVLRPGGKVVLFTPNSSSLGHMVFKEEWRGLEPPRHLHVFSMQSISRILKQTGFRTVSVRPQLARSIIRESVLLSWGKTGFDSVTSRNWRAATIARFFNLLELCLLGWKPSISDCVGAIAVK
jgi:2-polyprenyl-3-methyl-5-hydroxy-6-metoxy-1,4-benzoquinol methylase